MKQRAPAWCLEAACPGCSFRSLVLCACPGCGHLAARCDACDGYDLKTVIFADARRLSSAPLRESGSARCPSCGRHALASFRDATSEQVGRAGFTAREYR